MGSRGAGRNRVRIIGGTHRGRCLDFPDHEGLRPTADRVRETLFNWLSPVLEGSRCLDLFAGSGALGFEAASRGARKVVMIEASASVARQLEENARLLGAGEQVSVIRADALTWLPRDTGLYDVVFVDPPFADDLAPGVLKSLAASGRLAAGARIYVEQDARQSLPLPDGWQVLREKKAGQVAYRLIAADGSDGAAD